jgi:hypothetical protein
MLEAADLESKTVVLELEIAAHGFELTEHCNYRDSDTQDVVQTHMCWRWTPDDTPLDSRSKHCELHILVTDYYNKLGRCIW